MRIAIVAGEASGDLLGAGLIRALRERVPDLEVEGIGGPQMRAAGCAVLYPMERLSVMGLVEVAGRYLELIPVRRRLARRFAESRPDAFVGIDAPDFNLALEARLRAAGVRTVHYVSPSVWAWREYRLARIARAVDLMLTLFPFEARYYARHGVPVRFVGHPLADMIPQHTDRAAARASLGLAGPGEVVALLPGSRTTEVSRLAEPMLGAAALLAARRPGIRFVVPLVGEATRRCFAEARARIGDDLALSVTEAGGRTAMAAADAVLLASGTATLEALLLKRPMVITYKTNPITFRIMKAMLKVRHIGLPNLLAQRELVPELLQDQATPERLAAAVEGLLAAPGRQAALDEAFTRIGGELRQGADARAAEAVLELAAR